MYGVVFYVGSWRKTTLILRELDDPGGVPLQLRGTPSYPALSVDVVREEVGGG